MCKSIYLFINCGFCVWKLHLTQGPGMPGIQIPTFFYRAQAHRWQKPSRPPRWHRLEVLPPRGILQLGRAMSRQMFITSSKRRRKEIPFRFTIENNRKTHRFTSFLSWWLDNPKKILPTDTFLFEIEAGNFGKKMDEARVQPWRYMGGHGSISSEFMMTFRTFNSSLSFTLWEWNTCNWTKMPVYSMEYEHSVPPHATHTHTLAASSSTTSSRGSSITKKHCHCSCHPTRHHREGWGIPNWRRTWPENAVLCV